MANSGDFEVLFARRVDNNGHLQTNLIALFHNQLKQRTLQFIIFLSDVLIISILPFNTKKSALWRVYSLGLVFK